MTCNTVQAERKKEKVLLEKERERTKRLEAERNMQERLLLELLEKERERAERLETENRRLRRQLEAERNMQERLLQRVQKLSGKIQNLVRITVANLKPPPVRSMTPAARPSPGPFPVGNDNGRNASPAVVSDDESGQDDDDSVSSNDESSHDDSESTVVSSNDESSHDDSGNSVDVHGYRFEGPWEWYMD